MEKYEKILEGLETAWKRAANHERLDIEDVNSLHDAIQVFLKITHSGESFCEMLDNLKSYVG